MTLLHWLGAMNVVVSGPKFLLVGEEVEDEVAVAIVEGLSAQLIDC